MIQVTLLDTIELATFCVRTFSLHKVRLFVSTRVIVYHIACSHIKENSPRFDPSAVYGRGA